MKRYLELTDIARALKAECWRRRSETVGRGQVLVGGNDANRSDPPLSAAGLTLTAGSAGSP